MIKIGKALEAALAEQLPAEEGDLDPCPTCNTDRVAEIQGPLRPYRIRRGCPCDQAAFAAQQGRRHADERLGRWRSRAREHGLLLPESTKRLFDISPPQAEAVEPYRHVARWVKRWILDDPVKSVILCGPAGVGKSTLVRSAAWQIQVDHMATVAYFRGTKWDAHSATEIRAMLPFLQQADLLVYDELGKERMRGSIPGWLMEVFSERSDEKRPTLFTMNHNDKGLQERWTDVLKSNDFTEDQAKVDVIPLVSRVYTNAFLVEFGGFDLRLTPKAATEKS